ncbi:Protein kinase domain-containing protein [Psidium guajava]|nr:Protein kinase domain-containing protein [Psidium guajava]
MLGLIMNSHSQAVSIVHAGLGKQPKIHPSKLKQKVTAGSRLRPDACIISTQSTA